MSSNVRDRLKFAKVTRKHLLYREIDHSGTLNRKRLRKRKKRSDRKQKKKGKRDLYKRYRDELKLLQCNFTKLLVL